MAFVVDDKRFPGESEANAYAETHGLVILEFFADDGDFVADYEYALDD